MLYMYTYISPHIYIIYTCLFIVYSLPSTSPPRPRIRMSAPREQGLSPFAGTVLRRVPECGHILPEGQMHAALCTGLPANMRGAGHSAAVCPSGLLGHTSASEAALDAPCSFSTHSLPQPRGPLSSLGQSCLALTDHVFFQIYYLCPNLMP